MQNSTVSMNTSIVVDNVMSFGFIDSCTINTFPS